MNPGKAKTLQALRWFAVSVDAATRVANLQDTSPVPRDELATRLRQFVALFDRERAWPALERGEGLRSQALSVADTLSSQGERQKVGIRGSP
jgi:hypothetical protein